ncbi:MAG: YkgJ family cysteine cluster protein [Promethearchaeota archaeon]
MSESEEAPKPRQKFKFKCTGCGACCERGNVPLTFWDLELWARNKVVANMLYNVSLVTGESGVPDLVFRASPDGGGSSSPAGVDGEAAGGGNSPGGATKGGKCPYFNASEKKCTIYENRPLACRSFPLEYDGQHYLLAELECPGVGEGPMTKEELAEIRNYARIFLNELRRTRVALPILTQVIGAEVERNFLAMLQKQSEAMMANMSEEDRRKIDEIYKKSAPGDDPA